MESDEDNDESLGDTEDGRMTVTSDSSQNLFKGKKKETKVVTLRKCRTLTYINIIKIKKKSHK